MNCLQEKNDFTEIFPGLQNTDDLEDDDLINLISDALRDSGNSSDCSSTISSNYRSTSSANIIQSKSTASKTIHQQPSEKFKYVHKSAIQYQNDSKQFQLLDNDVNQDGDDENEDDDYENDCSTNEVSISKNHSDQRMLNDDRTVLNLLQLEDYYRINSNYFLFVQNEIKPWMRKTLANWMLEVCKNQSRETDIFVLAMNILDRFLSIQLIGKRHLQLLGTVCMFIAAKIRSATHFNAETLVIYTANSITIEELLNWEQFVLQKLRWDICSITPNDFLPFLLNKLNLVDHKCIKAINEYTNTFISLCSTEFKFSLIPSSMIASSCLYVTLNYLNIETTHSNVLNEMITMTNIDLECLKESIQQVIDIIETNLNLKIAKVLFENQNTTTKLLNSCNNDYNDSMLYETASVMC
jgi:cyclin D2